MPNLDKREELRTLDDAEQKEAQQEEKFEVDTQKDNRKDLKVVGNYSPIKQEKVAEVITGKGSGSVAGSPAIASRSVGSYGGNDVNITGDLSSTPGSQGASQKGTRFGKKLDETARRINELGSEQVLVETKGPKPLHESKDEVQGYSGRITNQRAVRTKQLGATPAASTFQRSVDEIYREELVYGHGQVVKLGSMEDNYQDMPTHKEVFSGAGVLESTAVTLGKRGNFVPKSLTVKISNAGVIKDFKFDVDDISVTTTDETVLQASAQHAKTHINLIEAMRRDMETKSADESAEGWSPLSRGIKYPKETLSLIYDYEQDLGNHAYLSNRFAKMSLAYQLNRTGKDGDELHRGIVESLLAPVTGYLPYDSVEYTVQEMLNEKTIKERGSAALLITAFDSVAKYNTKADLLNQPRSFKMHVNTGNNHISGLKANPDMVKYFENNQVFSTIDHEYDGIKPVFINSAYRIASAFDWSKHFSFTGATSNGNIVELKDLGYEYSYYDNRNPFITRVTHPLLRGVYEWFIRHAHSIRRSIDRSSNSDLTISIPIVYSVTAMTLWQFIVNSAMDEIKNSRLESFRDILQYTENHGYPFTNLKDIEASMTTDSANFTFNGISNPITVQKMTTVPALSWKMPELFWPADEKGSNDYKVVMPWYMGEDYLERKSSTFHLNEVERTINFPVIRSGHVLSGLTDMFDMGERNVRLSLDILVQPMSPSLLPAGVALYKYNDSDSGIVTIDESVNKNLFTYGSLLKQPRELGLRVVLPRGYAIPAGTTPISNILTQSFLNKVGYIAKYYFQSTKRSLNENPFIDSAEPKKDIGTLYSQKWDYYIPGDDSHYLENTNGINLGLASVLPEAITGTISDVFQGIGVLAGKTMFSPFVEFNSAGNLKEKAGDEDYKLFSLHSHFWFRTQMLPFVVNPFDIGIGKVKTGENQPKYDVFDFAYMFGLAGFRVSDFSEDHYLRQQKDLDEGYAYIRDRYMESTKLING